MKHLTLLILSLLFFPHVLIAQVCKAPPAKTTADAKISADELKARLRPLTAKEIAIEVDAWIAIFQKKAQEISDADVTRLSQAGAARTMSATTVKTPDNQIIIIPIGSICGGIIKNVTGSATRRIDLVFGIGYEDDIARAQAILEEIVNGHELVLPDPAPVVKLHELADSSVNFIFRPWAKTGDYWDVYWDLTRAVKERFDAEGISIPYPQTDVHVHQVTAGS